MTDFVREFHRLVTEIPQRTAIITKVNSSAENHRRKIIRHNPTLVESYNGNEIDKMNRDCFMEFCLWDKFRCAVEIYIASKDGICPYCGNYYKDLWENLRFGKYIYGIIEVETIDSSELPYWGINTQLCCASCNRRKHNKTMRDFVELVKRADGYDFQSSQMRLF